MLIRYLEVVYLRGRLEDLARHLSIGAGGRHVGVDRDGEGGVKAIVVPLAAREPVHIPTVPDEPTPPGSLEGGRRVLLAVEEVSVPQHEAGAVAEEPLAPPRGGRPELRHGLKGRRVDYALLPEQRVEKPRHIERRGHGVGAGESGDARVLQKKKKKRCGGRRCEGGREVGAHTVCKDVRFQVRRISHVSVQYTHFTTDWYHVIIYIKHYLYSCTRFTIHSI